MEKDQRVEADQFTYAAVLHCCTTACKVEEGKFYFNCIKKPNITHYALMVSLLARAGLFDEARSFIEEHHSERHAGVLRTLLDGCWMHHRRNIGKQVFEQLFDLEPRDAENYVLLSKWYSDNENWDLADKLRETIMGTGSKPKKGYSWIEFQNKVHVFGTGDISHPRSEGIYTELQCLMKKVKMLKHRGLVQLVLTSLTTASRLKEGLECGTASGEKGYRKDPEIFIITFNMVSDKLRIPFLNLIIALQKSIKGAPQESQGTPPYGT
ncbi:hypothetical protein OIU84_003785 [Salix udensis]|uniref:Pentatricopeptide repeat-containing protein n=1 Tax=Salix udensis TaxID=889485 RepID=A0AAD6P2Z9_9ROSI|nr:hypothetical protein OIU84_003785 [Salix udensis]